MDRRDTSPRLTGSLRLLGGLVLSAQLLACSQGPVDPPDGDAGADTSDGGPRVAPPDIPWLAEGIPPIAPPVLTPCPEGWHEVLGVGPGGDASPLTCDPYGSEPDGSEPEACPDGSAHFVGEAGCTPVGSPCPAGDFPEGLPTDVEVIYVLAVALPGGDGSVASPLTTIAAAMALASRGAIIAIGKGEYDEPVRVGPGITLWGACAAQTRLTASSPGSLAQGVITVPSADVQLTNLGIGPADLPGLATYGSRASVSVDGLVIEETRRAGLLVSNGARVQGRDLTITHTRADGAGAFGRGIWAAGGSAVDLSRVVLSHNREAGVAAVGGGTVVTLSKLVVYDTQAQESDGTAGQGLLVHSGARATIAEAVVVRNRDVAVLASGAGTSVTLSDIIVRDTQGQESDGRGGRAMNVQDGAALVVTRALLSHNRDFAVFANGEGTSATLSDLIVRRTLGRQSDGTRGRGVAAQFGALTAVTRALFSENRQVAISGDGEGTELTLSDVIVEDTRPQERDGVGGRGLALQLGAAATVNRALLARNRDLGVHASGAGTSMMLSDVAVRDTRGQESDGQAGRGMNVQFGATAQLTRTVFSRSHEIGIQASGEGTLVTLSDLVVEETQGQESDGVGGRGLNVQEGAAATVIRALLSRNRDVGVNAVSVGTTVQLSDVVVTQTDEQACSSTSCMDRPFGVGLVGASAAHLSATRFQVLGSALCGVLVTDDGQVDLSTGEVSGSQIGVCLQVDGYAISRLTDGVRYVDNDTRLDATSLPLPALANTTDEVE